MALKLFPGNHQAHLPSPTPSQRRRLQQVALVLCIQLQRCKRCLPVLLSRFLHGCCLAPIRLPRRCGRGVEVSHCRLRPAGGGGRDRGARVGRQQCTAPHLHCRLILAHSRPQLQGPQRDRQIGQRERARSACQVSMRPNGSILRLCVCKSIGLPGRRSAIVNGLTGASASEHSRRGKQRRTNNAGSHDDDSDLP